MKLETQRLELVFLTAEQLMLWLNDPDALMRGLDCTYAGEPLTGEFRTVLQGQCALVRERPDAYVWLSFVLLIRRCDRVVVGSADFKGMPSETGEVEIGYGLGEAFLRQGYMREAVEAMCAWALGQPGVRAVVAETERDNTPSQHVLAACGFTQFHKAGAQTFWWRRDAASCSVRAGMI